MKRSDGRRVDQLRPVRITRNFLKYAEGSALIEMGNTKVLCAATIEESIPHHKRGSGEGWVTAEYSMLPRAGTQRSSREIMRPKGRSQEIQRLIGRSLRAVINLGLLGERTIILDSDVIQADGGTRTASITGAYIALHEAIRKLLADKKIEKDPLTDMVAAISVGRINGSILLDLNYEEDFQAQVDMNVVMTASGGIIEVQGTAEGAPFSQKDMDEMMKKASAGIADLIKIQKRVLKA